MCFLLVLFTNIVLHASLAQFTDKVRFFFSLVVQTPLGLLGRNLSPKAFPPPHSWLPPDLRIFPVQSHQSSFAGREDEALARPCRHFSSHHTVSLWSAGPVQPQSCVLWRAQNHGYRCLDLGLRGTALMIRTHVRSYYSQSMATLPG